MKNNELRGVESLILRKATLEGMLAVLTPMDLQTSPIAGKYNVYASALMTYIYNNEAVNAKTTALVNELANMIETLLQSKGSPTLNIDPVNTLIVTPVDNTSTLGQGNLQLNVPDINPSAPTVRTETTVSPTPDR